MGIRTVDIALSADANQALKNGTDNKPFVQTVIRAFASDTAVAPASPGNPTTGEIAAWASGQSVTEALVYYTGTDTSSDPSTHVFFVAGDGSVESITPVVRGFHNNPIFWVATQVTEDPWASPFPVTITRIDLYLETLVTGSGAITFDVLSGATSLLLASVNVKTLSVGWNSIALTATPANLELAADETLTIEFDASDPLNTDMAAGAIVARLSYMET